MKDSVHVLNYPNAGGVVGSTVLAKIGILRAEKSTLQEDL